MCIRGPISATINTLFRKHSTTTKLHLHDNSIYIAGYDGGILSSTVANPERGITFNGARTCATQRQNRWFELVAETSPTLLEIRHNIPNANRLVVQDVGHPFIEQKRVTRSSLTFHDHIVDGSVIHTDQGKTTTMENFRAQTTVKVKKCVPSCWLGTSIAELARWIEALRQQLRRDNVR